MRRRTFLTLGLLGASGLAVGTTWWLAQVPAIGRGRSRLRRQLAELAVHSWHEALPGDHDAGERLRRLLDRRIVTADTRIDHDRLAELALSEELIERHGRFFPVSEWALYELAAITAFAAVAPPLNAIRLAGTSITEVHCADRPAIDRLISEQPTIAGMTVERRSDGWQCSGWREPMSLAVDEQSECYSLLL